MWPQPALHHAAQELRAVGASLKEKLSWAQQGKHTFTKALDFQFLLLFSKGLKVSSFTFFKKKKTWGQPRQSVERLAPSNSLGT